MINIFHPEFIICIGDDTTDEDMFKALENKAVTIKIGMGATAAHYNLRTQKEVIPLLQQFVKPRFIADNHHSHV
jgi:trehalose 6-phosphate synthase/phosphatase